MRPVKSIRFAVLVAGGLFLLRDELFLDHPCAQLAA
jgi:hypothetical protein